MAALTWTLISWKVTGKPSVVGAASGAVAGLVAITPASGYVEPMEAIAIGFGAGLFCYFAVRFRQRIHFDDSLDVVAVHGVGGLWGALATGLFATAAVGAPEFREGLIHGEWRLLWDQVIGIAAVGGYSFVVTYGILKVLDMTFGVRLSEEDEEVGLDVTQHGERAYQSDEAGIAIPVGIIETAPAAEAGRRERQERVMKKIEAIIPSGTPPRSEERPGGAGHPRSERHPRHRPGGPARHRPPGSWRRDHGR